MEYGVETTVNWNEQNSNEQALGRGRTRTLND